MVVAVRAVDVTVGDLFLGRGADVEDLDLEMQRLAGQPGIAVGLAHPRLGLPRRSDITWDGLSQPGVGPHGGGGGHHELAGRAF